MATDFGCPLSARFAIHPRPYDRLLAIALETFTRAPAGQEDKEFGLVAEYLAFFLDGPFNAVRKHESHRLTRDAASTIVVDKHMGKAFPCGRAVIPTNPFGGDTRQRPEGRSDKSACRPAETMQLSECCRGRAQEAP